MSFLDLLNQQRAARAYDFAETSGSTLADSIGGVTATIVGTPAFGQPSPIKGARSLGFNGTEHINLGTLPDLADAFATGLVFGAVVQSANTSSRMDLIGVANTGAPDNDIRVEINRDTQTAGAGRVGIVLKDRDGVNRTNRYAFNTGVTDGNYHSVIVVFRRGLIQLYVDGILQAPTSVIGQSPDNFGGLLVHDLFLGASNNNDQAVINPWVGQIAFPFFTPGIVTQSAIEAIAAGGGPITVDLAPGETLVFDQGDSPASIFGVDVAHPDRYSISGEFLSTDQGDAVDFGVGGAAQAVTLNRNNLANRSGSLFEDGVVGDVSAGDLELSLSSPQSLFRSVTIRRADVHSGTVLEAGSATHCSPHAVETPDGRIATGTEIYTGERWAWSDQSLGGVPTIDAIPQDRNERYHNGASLVSLPGGVAHLAVGHNQLGLRLRTSANDLTGLSAEVNLGPSGSQLTYIHAAATDAGDVVVLTRNQRSSDSAQVMTVADVFGTPTLSSDTLIFGANMYPRGMVVIGAGRYVLMARRQIPGAWDQGLYFAAFDEASGTWSSLDGSVVSSPDRGLESAPRFASLEDIRIRPDAPAGRQEYYCSTAAVTHDSNGDPMVAIMAADTATDDPNAYAPTTVSVLVWADGEMRQHDLPVPTQDSYRLGGGLWWHGGSLYYTLGDREGQAPLTGDEVGPYYDWGTRAKIVSGRIDGPTTAAPTFAPGPTQVLAPGELAGWIQPVGGADSPTFSHQRGALGGHATQASAFIDFATIPAQETSMPLIDAVAAAVHAHPDAVAERAKTDAIRARTDGMAVEGEARPMTEEGGPTRTITMGPATS